MADPGGVLVAVDTAHRLRRVVVRSDRAGRLRQGLVTRGESSAGGVAADLSELLAVGGEVEAIVVVVGPGSHTGVRAGMAAALGFAQGLDIPLHGVGALEVAAWGATVVAAGAAPEGWAVADAGRGHLFVARYRVEGTRLELGHIRRERADRWRPQHGGDLTVSLDPVGIDSMRLLDDAGSALAAAAAVAAARPPLPRAGLTAALAIPAPPSGGGSLEAPQL